MCYCDTVAQWQGFLIGATIVVSALLLLIIEPAAGRRKGER